MLKWGYFWFPSGRGKHFVFNTPILCIVAELNWLTSGQSPFIERVEAGDWLEALGKSQPGPRVVASMAAELGDLLNGVVAEAGDASLLELLPKRIRLYGPQPQPEASSFVGNRVHTHRYTLLNYLPISVCEQLNPFEKFANAYFLFVGCLQAVPQITVTGGVPVLLGPLLFVTGIDAMLKLYEDLQRRKADALTNQQATRVLNPHSGAFEPRRWDELRVGDIVSVRNREIFPADMLLLGADGPEGMTGHVWVSTKSLDGETDAKLREAPKATVQRLVAAGLPALLQLRGHMRCEAPNNITSDFSGLLYLAEPADLELPLASPRGQGGPSTVAPSLADALEVSAVSEDNMLLRGCLLRNTRECYGLVVSCGTQTKIQYAPARRMGAARLGALGRALGGLSRLCVGGSAAGSGHKPASEKVGAMTARVNLDILGIVAILVALSVVGVVLHFAACTALVRAGEDLWYLGVAPPAVQLDAAQREAGDGLCEDGASLFGRYFLLSYNLIPVSLYVSISLVLIWVAMLMANDLGMYDPSQDQPALVRNMSLCDELGRISHVLSDKTGTLTANHMRLRRLTLGEAVYGSGSAINPLSAIKTPKRGPLRAAPRGFAAAAAAQAARDGGGGASAAVARPRSATDSAGSSVVALPPVAGASLREAAERFASPEPPAVIPQAHSQSAHSARSRVGAPDGVADWYGCKRDTAAYVAYEEGEAGGESLYAALDAEVGGARAAQTRRELRLLLLHLASNHSVLHEAVGGMATELAASSPDELAFVAAAEHFGYEFTARDLSKGALLVRDKRQGAASAEHVLDVLAVFPYVSSRKRMTTVVRLPPSLCADGDAGVYVFTKGADSVLLPMLAPPAASAAAAHANSSRRVGALRRTTGRWADEALRTLVFACRLVPEAEVDGWVARLKAAHEDPRERTALKAGLDNAIDRLQQEVEIGLLLQGASAVEDQLQAGVPETLRDLSAAGIKVWMLTGDKVGTAKNIAAACSLLPASCDDADDATLDDEGRASGSARASGKALDVAAEPGAAPSAFVWIVREGSARGAIAATAPGARGRVAPPSHRSRASRPSRRAAELSGTRVVEWTTETVDGLDDVPPSELASASSAVAEATAEANLARARGALRGALDAPYHVLVRARLLRPRPSTLGAAALAARALIEALERKYPALALLSAQCVEEGARLAGAADPAHPSLAPAADSAGSVAGGAAGGADAKPRAAAPTSHTVVLDEKAIDWLAAACPAEFAAFVNTARAVIGCRCRQEQKAQMVRIVRDNAVRARASARASERASEHARVAARRDLLAAARPASRARLMMA
jgi:magnesium-transporting ATPase (P-type)